MAKKKKTASPGGGVLGALASTAFSDEGAAASSLFSASEASLPPAPLLPLSPQLKRARSLASVDNFHDIDAAHALAELVSA